MEIGDTSYAAYICARRAARCDESADFDQKTWDRLTKSYKERTIGMLMSKLGANHVYPDEGSFNPGYEEWGTWG